MPVILATQETEIRRIEVGSQPSANTLCDPISKKNHKERAGRVTQVVRRKKGEGGGGGRRRRRRRRRRKEKKKEKKNYTKFSKRKTKKI
jgi:hypothetical protein